MSSPTIDLADSERIGQAGPGTPRTASRSASTSASLHPLLAERWSPRAWADAAVAADSLRALFEAARWAASANNTQPWRFVVGIRGDSTWDLLHDALASGNQRWADAAPVLVLASAVTTDGEADPRPYAPYELGLAVAQLTVQAHAEGLHVHQMGGFDKDQVRAAFGIPASVTPYTVLAIGELGDRARLSEDLAEREAAPRHRRPLTELVFSQAWDRAANLGLAG